jgi:predicted membrane-bound spermidine synthase
MLALAVFFSGMTTLAIELTASRLLGNVFGTSNIIWASVIGLILLYLTVGYFVGGWLADRYPTRAALYKLMAWGAFTAGVIPFAARPVLSSAAGAVIGFQAGAAVGAFVAVLILFALPVVLLGGISPFAIRLAIADVKQAGKISGRMYAISTLGSLLGTFIPVLWLIPEAGTTRTFVYFALLLITVAFIGLAREQRPAAILRLVWMPLALLALLALALSGPLRPPAEGQTLLYEKDSAYNYIQVIELDAPIGRIVDGQWQELWPAGTRELHLNEGQGVHSVYHPAGGFFAGTWDIFLAVPFFNAAGYGPAQVKSLAVIGLAAGTISTQYASVFGPDTRMVGVEIDPEIVAVGQQYFGMNQPNLQVIIDDGRSGLRQTTDLFDVIAIDAYRVPYVPWQLTTLEFFQEMRARLNPNGVLAINVGRAGADRRLVEAMSNTLSYVFPSLHTIDVPDSFNTILVATPQQTNAANLAANLALLPSDAPPLLREALTIAAANIVPTIRSQVLFTDDRAPVESIINAMVVDYLLGRAR